MQLFKKVTADHLVGIAEPRRPSAATSAARRDRLTPLLVGGAAVAGLAVLSARNPNVSGSYGVCPFKAVTGWDCPFCGGLRGTYALLHGDLMTALDHNALLPLLLAGLVGLVWMAWRGRPTSLPSSRPSARVFIALTVLALAAFWVARNLPGLEYLNSAAGTG